MNFDKMKKIIWRYIHRYEYFCAKFPKAAKKKRIRKKWAKRFNHVDFDLKEYLSLKHIPDGGAHIPTPLQYYKNGSEK